MDVIIFVDLCTIYDGNIENSDRIAWNCPRSIIVLSKASELRKGLNIPLHLRPLDFLPFIHFYGLECENANVVSVIWYLPVIDVSGNHLNISLYVKVGSNHPLIGLGVVNQGIHDLSQGILTRSGPNNEYLVLETYLDSPSVSSRCS